MNFGGFSDIAKQPKTATHKMHRKHEGERCCNAALRINLLTGSNFKREQVLSLLGNPARASRET